MAALRPVVAAKVATLRKRNQSEMPLVVGSKHIQSGISPVAQVNWS
jgi:hypothetical protein